MTVYEFNKANYGNLPTMTDEALAKSVPYVVSFLDKSKSRYYLMIDAPYEKDKSRYYTMFTFPNNNYNPGALAREILDIAKGLGPVKSIEDNTTMLEFWIGDKEDCRMYSLIDWSDGVIEIQ